MAARIRGAPEVCFWKRWPSAERRRLVLIGRNIGKRWVSGLLDALDEAVRELV